MGSLNDHNEEREGDAAGVMEMAHINVYLRFEMRPIAFSGVLDRPHCEWTEHNGHSRMGCGFKVT